MNTRGNVFIVIVAVLGIIFTMATFFMQATIEEKGQTEYSHRTVQTQCLAEAAMERAVRLLNQEMNDPEKAKDKTTIAGKLRQPMTVVAGAAPGTSGLGSSLGQDEPLVVPDDMKELIVMKNDDLQKETHELDELVTFMVGNDQKVKYEVEVKVGLSSAYRVAPGPSVEDAANKYYVPGVDIRWSMNPLVRDFLENKGFVALRMKFPEDWKWLQFKIPIKIGPLTIYEVDLVDLVNKAFPVTADYTKYFGVHELLATLFPSFYPYDIKFATDIFPTVADKLGPGVTPPPLDPKKPLEKYGFMSLESKAMITFPDSRTVTRVISAGKEFKCADIQPPAPMYSLFVANLKDEMLNLNDIGGNLYVNNFASFGAVKNGPGADNKEKYEFPGLVRFNGNKPMVCNISFIGNPTGPNLGEDGNDGILAKMGRGAEVPIMLDLGTEMKGIDTLGKDANLVAFVPKKYQEKFATEINTPVTWTQHSSHAKWGGTVNNTTGSYGSNDSTGAGTSLTPTPEAVNLAKPTNTTDKSVDAGSADSMADKIKGKLSGLLPTMPQINVLPPTSYGISLLGVALHLHPMLDPWAKWEWPFMGMGWRLFRIPNTGIGQNVTHLFGSGGIFPPMTRSIEGFVLKRYRQWNLGIVGWPMGPYPLVGNQITIPFTPPILLPPVPIPLWHTHDIVKKYDYNLWLLKSPKDKAGSEGDDDVVTYDPTIQENAPPNLYSIEQYAKKATYYYTSQADFYKDLPNRLIKVGDSQALRLNGITFIADSLVIPPVGSGSLKVTGKGAIVVGGNVILTGNIEDAYTPEQERSKDTPRTVFSLIARQGGLIFDSNATVNFAKIEGSVYTEKGIAVPKNKGLRIVGNWVTNTFNKATASGDIMVEYVGYKTRASLFSLHSEYGKYDPERYMVTLSPTWETWKVK